MTPATPEQRHKGWIVSTARACADGVWEGSIYTADREDTIARVFAESREELERRRALIASARELLAALQMMQRDGGCWCSEAERIRDYSGEHSPACQTARAAVQKATGATP